MLTIPYIRQSFQSSKIQVITYFRKISKWLINPSRRTASSRFRSLGKLFQNWVMWWEVREDNTLSTLEIWSHLESLIRLCSFFSSLLGEIVLRCHCHDRKCSRLSRSHCTCVDVYWLCAIETELPLFMDSLESSELSVTERSSSMMTCQNYDSCPPLM